MSIWTSHQVTRLLRSVTRQFFRPPFATEGALDDSDFSPQISEKREGAAHPRATVGGIGDPGWGKIFAEHDWNASSQKSLYYKFRELLKPEALLSTTARIRYYRQKIREVDIESEKIRMEFLQKKHPGHFNAGAESDDETTDGDDDEDEKNDEEEEEDNHQCHNSFLKKNFLTGENAQHLNEAIMRVVTSATTAATTAAKVAAKVDTDEKSAAAIEQLEQKVRAERKRRRSAESKLDEVRERVAKFARLLESETQ